MRQVKVGLIGCGMISDIYIKNSKEVFEILDICACADIDLNRAKQTAEKYNIKACTVEEILADSTIEIILNLTIPAAHAEIGLKAIANGKHIYSEKPLAINLTDSEQMLHIAKGKGLLVGCAPDTFLGGGLQTARKLLDEGWIGEVVGSTAFFLGFGPEAFHPNPEFFYKPGGGPMMDMGPYYITALVSLLGPVRKISGMTRMTYPKRRIMSAARFGEEINVEIPTYITGLLEFESGSLSNITTSYDFLHVYWESKVPFIQIFGSEGTLRIPDPNKYEGPVEVRRFGDEFIQMPLTHGFTGNSRGMGLADMAEALQTGGSHRANGQLANHVLETMLGFSQAAETEQTIHIRSRCDRPAPLPMALPKTMHYINQNKEAK